MNKQSLIPQAFGPEARLHISKIQAGMKEAGLEAMLVASNVNLYYCTGRFFRGYVYISERGAEYFVVRPQIFESGENVNFIRKPEQIPDILLEKGYPAPAVLGLEEDVLSYSDTLRLAKAFGNPELKNATGVLRSARMVKTPYELEQMKADGLKQARVYGLISGLYRPGMTDLQLQIEIERELRLEGCLGFARVAGSLMDINMGSVLAGDNADNPSPYEFAMGGEGTDTSLPGGANGTVIRPGQTVMIDMNGSFNAYQTDMTRCWSLGSLPDSALTAHECSREILRCLEETARPGLPVADLYLKAEEIASAAGLAEYFMGHRQKAGFIGHGVGIELNEQPPVTARNKTLLIENMTLALEPKFVLPGVGAVGVENTYRVGRDGLETLTRFPEEIQPL